VALVLLQSASVCAGSENPPLMGFILKCAPLPFFHRASSPGKQASRRSGHATVPTWAALVVSHHLGGLLRVIACGFIAPRYRFWSSLRFHCVPTICLPKQAPGPIRRFPATRFTPFEEYPSSTAVLHHCSRCLLVVTFHFTPHVPPRWRIRPDACSEKRGQSAAETVGWPVPVWRSRLASQSEVLVSQNAPKNALRESPWPRPEMP
jgi:hypothetical protein